MLELQHERKGYTLNVSLFAQLTRNYVPDAFAPQKQVLLLLFLRGKNIANSNLNFRLLVLSFAEQEAEHAKVQVRVSEVEVRVPRVRALGSEPPF